MDTAETYIKMSDCPEIQALRREEKHKDTGKWKDGDFWTTTFKSDRGHVFVVCKGNDAWADEPHYLHHPTECIWLPRQDQLQEMVNPNENLTIQLQGFGCIMTDHQFFGKAGSWEQLWLAFVMKEKYNKTWDKGQWCDKEG